MTYTPKLFTTMQNINPFFVYARAIEEVNLLSKVRLWEKPKPFGERLAERLLNINNYFH